MTLKWNTMNAQPVRRPQARKKVQSRRLSLAPTFENRASALSHCSSCKEIDWILETLAFLEGRFRKSKFPRARPLSTPVFPCSVALSPDFRLTCAQSPSSVPATPSRHMAGRVDSGWPRGSSPHAEQEGPWAHPQRVQEMRSELAAEAGD